MNGLRTLCALLINTLLLCMIHVTYLHFVDCRLICHNLFSSKTVFICFGSIVCALCADKQSEVLQQP